MNNDEAIPRPLYEPPIPYTQEKIDIPGTLITDLFLRRVYLEGTSTLESIGDSIKLSHPLVEAVFHSLRHQQLVEVRGMVGEDYRFSLSEAGRQMAMDRLNLSKYAGAAPVSVGEDIKAGQAQKAEVVGKRDKLKGALSDMIVTDDLLGQLGPAIISQKAMFLYGSTGSGKTSLAERLVKVYDDYIVIPYAVEVDGQIIIMFDPVVHERVDVELLREYR